MEQDIRKALRGLLLPDLINIVLDYVPPRLIVNDSSLFELVDAYSIWFQPEDYVTVYFKNDDVVCYDFEDFRYPPGKIKANFEDLRVQFDNRDASETQRLEIHPDEVIVYTQGHHFTLPIV
jgi:hypothetical protein